MPINPLHRLMTPSSIATFGANNNFMKMGTLQALSIIKDGYTGKFYPVHPREKAVMGHKAYASVAELPEPPDLAFLVVPSSQVVPIMEELGKKGTQSAIVITAGFGETGEDGQKIQDRLNEISRQYGIRFLGPNCMGIINSEIALNTTVMPYPLVKGSFGFASQSGTYLAQTIPYLKKRGIRFSKAISVGNSANIDITDALEYLGEDEQTKAISLYIESIKDVRRFVDAARRITPHKPVLAQYVGGSGAGARSALSHTGSMAAPDHLYEGMFRQAGVIRVQSIEELYGFGNMLAQQPALQGRRIGILTNSGGPGSAMANALEKAGLDVPRFSEALQSKIRPLVHGHAPCGNPVDLTFHLDIDTLTEKIPAIILESGEVDGLVLHGALRRGYLIEIYDHIKEALNNAPVEALLKDFQAIPEQSLALVSTYKKPVGISSFYDRDDDYTAAYQDHGIPVFDSPEKTAGALGALYNHFKVRQRPPWRSPAVPSPPVAAMDLIRECRARGQGNLDEYQSKCFLKAWGLPVNEETLVHSGKEAIQAADTLGYPIVLKASSPDIRHKTGKGFIHLDLDSADAVADAYEKIQKAAGKPVPVLAGRMLKGKREFVAGTVDHRGFGPSVMFGFGGIFTEALEDVVFRPAPLNIEDAGEMIADIRSKKLLGEFRGMPAVNPGTLAEIIHRLSLIPLAHPEIGEIDINPLIVEEDAPVAVDALVVLKS